MKYAYVVNSNGYIAFTNAEHMTFWIEMSEAEYNRCTKAMDGRTIPYCDKNGKIQFRDRNTIWDEESQSYIVDVVIVAKEAKEKLIGDARSQYHLNLLDRHQYHKLDVKQQKELDIYLDSLSDIFNGKVEVKELPIKPDWLK